MNQDLVKKYRKELKPSINEVKSFIKKPSINNLFKLSDKSLITLVASIILIVVTPISLVGVAIRSINNTSYCKDLREQNVKISSVYNDQGEIRINGYVPNTKIPKVFLDNKELSLDIGLGYDSGNNGHIYDYVTSGHKYDERGICQDLKIGVYDFSIYFDNSNFADAETLILQGNNYQITYNLKTDEQSVKFGKPKAINTENNKEDNADSNSTKKKALDITSLEVTSLIYPKRNRSDMSESSMFVYEDTTIDKIGHDYLMYNALLETKETYSSDGMTAYFSARELKSNFQKIFGPDANYEDKDFAAGGCGGQTIYNATHLRYENSVGCGGVTSYSWQNITKLYKAESLGDEIYTYFYVQPYIEDNMNYGNYYLFKRENSNNYNASDYSSVNITGYDKKVSSKKEIEDNLTNADTYQFTFKKQSDGKYYFISGKWQ